jgi:hypothetical protein
MTGSLAYRKNEAAILRADPPPKYTRILPHIPGGSVLEIGSAEGVLACLLAMQGRTAVTALEQNEGRHQVGPKLHAAWSKRFATVTVKLPSFAMEPVPFLSPRFECGNILDRLDLLDGVDGLVAVRMIYYLGERIDEVFAAAAATVKWIVLCGNRNRADAWRRGQPHAPLGEMNRYAAREGMRELLERHGFRIVDEVTEGDEIVVGQRSENLLG